MGMKVSVMVVVHFPMSCSAAAAAAGPYPLASVVLPWPANASGSTPFLGLALSVINNSMPAALNQQDLSYDNLTHHDHYFKPAGVTARVMHCAVFRKRRWCALVVH
jgi:hypothetical protein